MPTILDDLRDGNGPPLATISIEQYRQMIETGVLPDGAPIELIDGVLVLKDRRDPDDKGSPMTHGTDHTSTLEELRDLLDPLVRPHGYYVRTQLPVTLPNDSEPEPDLSVVRGRAADYRERQPGPADVPLVVEVSGRSLRQDRGTKVRLYAEAGIENYWIINLKSNRIEQHRRPLVGEGCYGELVIRLPGELCEFSLPDGTSIALNVATILH